MVRLFFYMPVSTYKNQQILIGRQIYDFMWQVEKSSHFPLYIILILLPLQEDYSHVPLYLILASTIVYFVLPCAIVTVLYIR